MGDKKDVGFLVRHIPCCHKRVVDAPSVKLALTLDGLLWCMECDRIGEWDLPEGLIEIPCPISTTYTNTD